MGIIGIKCQLHVHVSVPFLQITGFQVSFETYANNLLNTNTI